MVKKRIFLAIFVAVFIIVTIGHFPLSLALKSLQSSAEPVITVQQARGSIWSGKARWISLKGAALENVTLRTNPFKLLTGGAASRIQWAGAQSNGSAMVSLSANTVDVTALTLRAPLKTPAGAGVVSLSQGAVTFNRSGCTVAQGPLSVQINGQAEPFEGQIMCDNGVLVADLTVAGASLRVPIFGAGQ